MSATKEHYHDEICKGQMEAERTERAILFSTPMVKAILSGKKFQTRRILKPQIIIDQDSGYKFYKNLMFDIHDDVLETMYLPDNCNYGQVGDVLWVRETFYAYGHWTEITDTKSGEKEWHFNDLTLSSCLKYYYEDRPPVKVLKGRFGLGYFKRPSIFMPKVACRIKLLIKNIRVERLQNITKQDAIAEGILELSQSATQLAMNDRLFLDYSKKKQLFNEGLSSIKSYRTLWESINGKDSWSKNPWVWVIEFERIQPK